MNRRNSRQPKRNQHKINEDIKFDKVRLVGENIEEGVSVVSSYEASKIADELELDLVCINENADIPICKIMKYDKFIYEQEKNKKQVKSLALKEIKMGPNIGEHDLNTKVKQIIKFLDKGHKVKTYVQFRGREMAHQDLGMKVLLTLATMVEEYGLPEAIPTNVIGRKLTMFIKPKK